MLNGVSTPVNAGQNGGSSKITPRSLLLHCVLFQPDVGGSAFHPFQEFPVVAWSVRAEVIEDVSKRSLWHGDLQQIIAERDLFRRASAFQLEKFEASKSYHAIIRTTLASKGHRFFGDAFIHHAMGEHRLTRDAEDEGAKAGVGAGFTLLPHTSRHVNFIHRYGSLRPFSHCK